MALSGVAAGNTALCTVGRTGDDLHYRGYDIRDSATRCEFEEIAYLLIHGRLPDHAELAGYRRKLQSLRGLPVTVRSALEALPAAVILDTGAAYLAQPLRRARVQCFDIYCARHRRNGLRHVLVHNRS